MKRLAQLSVFAENKPGRIEKVTATLAGAAVNILAINITGENGFGIIRLIVDDHPRGRRALTAAGFTVSSNEVLAIELEDRPGGLHAVVEVLSGQGINIEDIHIFIPAQRAQAYLVVEVDDLPATERILARQGLATPRPGTREAGDR